MELGLTPPRRTLAQRTPDHRRSPIPGSSPNEGEPHPHLGAAFGPRGDPHLIRNASDQSQPEAQPGSVGVALRAAPVPDQDPDLVVGERCGHEDLAVSGSVPMDDRVGHRFGHGKPDRLQLARVRAGPGGEPDHRVTGLTDRLWRGGEGGVEGCERKIHFLGSTRPESDVRARTSRRCGGTRRSARIPGEPQPATRTTPSGPFVPQRGEVAVRLEALRVGAERGAVRRGGVGRPAGGQRDGTHRQVGSGLLGGQRTGPLGGLARLGQPVTEHRETASQAGVRAP